MSLTFIHLADIHFQVRKAVYDLDRDLRNELERDAREMLKTLPVPVSILIGGDVAFKGVPEEYDTAWEWLSGRLCPMLGTPTENIRCVPGNHDVNRTTIEHSRSMRDCYKRLREIHVNQIHDELVDYLQEPRVFYEKLAAYNRFAVKFDCDLSISRPYWESDYRLDDVTTLRVRGLNSTLISSQDDDDGANKLVVGEYQGVLQREDNVEYMVLCHHPPQWLRDQDRIQDALDSRSRIQLYGHKHVQKLTPIGDKCLRMSAGAVHPDRREPDWKPRYNWLQIAANEDASRSLEVTVYPRIWDNDKFTADYHACEGKDRVVQLIPLGPSVNRGPARVQVVQPGECEVRMNEPSPKDDPLAPQKPISSDAPNDPAWTLAHRYLSLSYVYRMAIAQGLKLIEDADEGLPQNEISRRVFRRARERSLLAELWDQVERQGAWTPEINPFRPSQTTEEHE